MSFLRQRKLFSFIDYGDVAVEHTGPRYGPMCGQEMVFVVLRGRIVKDEISVIISEQKTSWSQEIQEFTLNGNVIYFIMPPFPSPQITPVQANIKIYFQNRQIHESKYLYMSTIDRMFILFLPNIISLYILFF